MQDYQQRPNYCLDLRETSRSLADENHLYFSKWGRFHSWKSTFIQGNLYPNEGGEGSLDLLSLLGHVENKVVWVELRGATSPPLSMNPIWPFGGGGETWHQRDMQDTHKSRTMQVYGGGRPTQEKGQRTYMSHNTSSVWWALYAKEGWKNSRVTQRTFWVVDINVYLRHGP